MRKRAGHEELQRRPVGVGSKAMKSQRVSTFHTNLESKIAPKGHPGDKEEMTDVYRLVRRGNVDESTGVR